ncbi:MAG: type VI secretion system tube protein Hcp [Pseudomonadota bacterium]
MSFDAFCYFPKDKKTVMGETQDKKMKDNGAFEILSFEIGAENNINIGSITGGGGAGKATFKELNVTKKTDTCSCALFMKLCEGKHFDEMVIELRRSGAADGVSGKTFLKWQFQLVMVQDISWSGSDGDDICEETVVFQYGAMKVEYWAQDAQGKMNQTPLKGEWSRVLNEANFAVK